MCVRATRACTVGNGRSLLLAGWLGWLFFQPAIAADSPAELAARLGDDSFQARQEASRKLVRLGLAAQPALVAAAKHRDPEVRRRAKHLLQEVVERDYHARLAAFEADTEGQADPRLPGWSRFKTLVGDSGSARRLFVAMHREEPSLMLAAEELIPGHAVAEWAEHAGKVLEVRCQELQAWLYEEGRSERELTPGTAAAFYLLASDARVPLSEIAASHVMNLFNYRATVPQALGGQGTYSPQLKRLVGAWVSRELQPYLAMQNFTIALQYGLRDALPPAVKLLEQTGADAQSRQYAIHVVGRFGDKSHVSELAKTLADKSVCMTLEIRPGKTVEVQMRDIALGMLVHLTGQNVKDYGFSGSQRNTHWVFLPGSLRFEDDAQRDRALAKWDAWVTNKPAEAPADGSNPAGAAPATPSPR